MFQALFFFVKVYFLVFGRYVSHACDMVNKNPVVVLVGETGSGKTTQVPQYLAQQLLGRGFLWAVQNFYANLFTLFIISFF